MPLTLPALLRSPRSSFLLCAALLFSAIALYCQAYLGTVRGTVTDPSGAVVPNASITLKEPATGVEVRRGATDSSGNFEFSDIKPGTYRLSCEAGGFKPSLVNGIVLEAGQIRRIDISTTVGAVAQEAVKVNAGVALIDTDSGTISAEYTIKQHADVPLVDAYPIVDAYPTPATMVTTLAGIQGGGGSWGGVRANGQSMTLVLSCQYQ